MSEKIIHIKLPEKCPKKIISVYTGQLVFYRKGKKPTAKMQIPKHKRS